MLGRRRQKAALLALGAAVIPWLSAGVGALHLNAHAIGGDHEHESAAAVAVHGHHHEPGTPDHQHLLSLPCGAPPPARATLAPLFALLGDVAPDGAGAAVRKATGAGSVGHDRPSAGRVFSVLRI